MHKILIRLKIIKENRIIDVRMDNRLSLIDNLSFIGFLAGISFKDSYIYDPNKKIFLDRNIPLSQFDIRDYMMLYLF